MMTTKRIAKKVAKRWVFNQSGIPQYKMMPRHHWEKLGDSIARNQFKWVPHIPHPTAFKRYTSKRKPPCPPTSAPNPSST